MEKPIYLDYMATTPVDPRVSQAMRACLEKEGVFGNPASRSHPYGWEAEACVEKAQEQVASLIHAEPREIIWTSGATESNNLAIKGAAHFYRRKGKHIITMSTEHKAVLDTCRHLEGEAFEVTYLDPEPNGLLDLNKLKAAIRPDTLLVSVMHVNNETGVIQDIQSIAKLAHEAGALFHSDAVQSAGKVPIDVREMKIDLMSFSGHKVYGPKGIGVLFVSRSPRIRLTPQIHGGAQQSGLRAGTLPTHQIVGMGEAFAIAKQDFESDKKRLELLSKRLRKALQVIPGVTLNGDLNQRVGHCLNICIDNVDAEMLLPSLNNIAISSGSACNSANPEPSHVLSAMGLSRDQANHSIRISLGRFATEDEVQRAIECCEKQIKQLQQRPSLWNTVDETS